MLNDLSQVVLTLTNSSGQALTNGAALAAGCVGSEHFGYVTFTGCSVAKDGTYTLTATDTSLPGVSAVSQTFTVLPGPPSQIVFSTQPGNSTGGVAFTPQPKLTVEDAGGNPVTTDTSTATLAVTTGTGTGTLSGCTQSGESAGVISFTGCSINTAGTTYTLTATDVETTGTLMATSASFSITVGAAVQLVFTSSPGASASGATFATQPVITVEDAGGNTVNSGVSITLGIASQPTSGATISCTGGNPKSATAGVDTFSGCKITNGSGEQGSYTLKATATGLPQATSGSFTVAGTASKLAFATQPPNTTTAAVFTTSPVVWVEDSSGDLVTNAANTVTLAINSGTGTLSGCTSAVTPSGGIATFPNCKITLGTQGSFTLKASANPALTVATSNTFTVAGTATKLIFTQQPTNSTGGVAFPTQPKVSVEDSSNDVVTSSAASVTLAITGGTSGAALSCTSNPLTPSGGVVAFSGCAINLAGTGYKLTASASGLTGTTSSAINITIGPANQLAFTTQPGGGQNAATWAGQPVVKVEDAGGNAVTTATSQISLTIASQPGTGAAITCTNNPVVATAGVAAFSGCQLVGTAGSYTLAASSPGLVNGTSASFTITPGSATQLVFTTQPNGGANTAAWTTQPAVTVEDSGGNKVTAGTYSVTLAVAENAGGALACTTNPLSTASGVATYAGCKITGTAGTYALSASATGLSSATSSIFSISAGPATQLAFSTQPGGGADAATWSTQPIVSVEDVSGNLVGTSSASITLSIHSQPGSGASLACSNNPLAASGGVAGFSGCAITGTVGSYTLSASATGLSGATSNAFIVTIGGPAKLGFSTQPGGGVDGNAWGTQPVVTVEDAGGNTVTGATNSITLAIGTNPGGTLACATNPLAATGGTASFAGCEITGKAGTYTLTASATGLSGATSNTFSITVGNASKLGFSAQPGGGANAATWSTQPAVTVEDVGGNTVTGATNSITLALGTNPGGTLACTTNPLAATGGTASFAGCKITGKAGTYTLTASATGLSQATSNTFSITAGPATQLAINVQPGGGADGATWSSQPVVTVEDQSGNTVTGATNSITLAIATQPGTGATLGCTTNPLAATGGTASFAGCKITGKAGTYTLTASATGLSAATSNTFTITIGAPTQLVFSTQPGGGANAATWTTQPVVTVEDAGGNTVTGATNSITLALGTNPGGTLACTTNPLAAAGGTASFAGCKITGKAGTYTLTASATGLSQATSNTLSITPGAATQLAFSTQPGGGANAATWSTQPAVSVEDQSGNTVTGATNSITLALGTNPGGTLACTTNPLAATGGTASFAGCEITGKAGTYTLTASATGLSATTSNTFSITAGPATQLAFSAQPGGGANAAAWTTQPVVTVEDQSGNTVTGATNSITLAIGTNPGGTLACTTNPKTAAAGIATFAGCKITGKAGTYTLTASATGLSAATSNTFSITAGPATQLAFSTQPGGGTNAATWTTQPVVTVEDAGGNTVTGATNSITLALGTDPGGTLACTTNPLAATGGTASFAGCKITGKAGTYTLTASAFGLTGATSNTFSITPGAATQLAFSTQPGGGANAATWSTQPAVSVEDQSGNTVTGATNSITLALGTNPGGTLACTTNPLDGHGRHGVLRGL